MKTVNMALVALAPQPYWMLARWILGPVSGVVLIAVLLGVALAADGDPRAVGGRVRLAGDDVADADPARRRRVV